MPVSRLWRRVTLSSCLSGVSSCFTHHVALRILYAVTEGYNETLPNCKGVVKHDIGGTVFRIFLRKPNTFSPLRGCPGTGRGLSLLLRLLPYQPAARRPISPRVIFCGLFPRKGASGCTLSQTPRKEGGSGKTGGGLPSMYSFIQHTRPRPFPSQFT